VRAQITTKGTGVFTTAFASDNMPEGVAWTVAGSIMGRGTGVRCLISATTLYYRDPGGVATFQGIWGNPNIIVGALSAQFALNGNSVLLQVIDDAVHTVSWDVFVEMREVR
jgi:hypothetical protein